MENVGWWFVGVSGLLSLVLMNREGTLQRLGIVLFGLMAAVVLYAIASTMLAPQTYCTPSAVNDYTCDEPEPREDPRR